jgi:hypothetical protein
MNSDRNDAVEHGGDERRGERVNRDRDDERIRALFDALRKADEPEIPPFERIWEGTRARVVAAREGRTRRRIAVAVVAACLIVGSIVLLGRRGPFLPSRAQPSITEWRSPTAALLVYSGSGLRAAELEEEALSAPAGTRFVSTWSSPTASLLRPPGGGGATVGGRETTID